jgi:hypothetical protein
VNAKLLIGKRVQKTQLTGRSPLRRRKSTLGCSAIEKKKRRTRGGEEGEKEKGEDEVEEKGG